MSAFPAIDPGAAITPHRYTYILYNVPDATKIRDPWMVRREAADMARGANEAGAPPLNMALYPSGCWGIFPYQLANLVELVPHSDSAFTTVDLLTSIALSVITYQQRKSLTGVIAGPGVVTTGDDFLVKRVDDTQNWNHEALSTALANDAASFGKVPYDSQNYRMARTVVSAGIGNAGSYPANKAFGLRLFAAGTQMSSPDNLITAYFGGSLDPNGAGSYAAALKGSGLGDLWEKDARVTGGWRRVLRNFRWAAPGRVAGLGHNLLFVPHGNDTLDIIAGTTDASVGGIVRFLTPMSPSAGAQGNHSTVYRIKESVCKHPRHASVTGRGQFRLDIREDLRFPFQPSRLAFPMSATLADDKYEISPLVPPDTGMTVLYKADKPDGTTLTPAIKYVNGAGATVACATNPDGSFKVVAGIIHYWVEWTFAGDGQSTPFLYFYTVHIPGAVQQTEPTPITGGILRSVSITGPDFDPSHEGLTAHVSDPAGELGILGVREQIHCKVITKWDYPNDPTKETVSFEGHTAGVKSQMVAAETTDRLVYNPTNASSKPFPKIAAPWPHDWKEREVPMLGMFTRFARPVLTEWSQNYAADANAPRSGTGDVHTWRMVDIIRDMLHLAGLEDWQIDIPDIPDRFWASSANAQEAMFRPGLSPMEIASSLTRTYMGLYGLWCANSMRSGSPRTGMWRVFAPPQPPFPNPLWTFVTKPPAWIAPHPVTHPYSYPPATTFCEAVHSWVEPPEGNDIAVMAGNNIDLDSPANTAVRARLINDRSFDVPGRPPSDPLHPDWLGYHAEIVYPFPALNAAGDTEAVQAACNALCLRLFLQTAFGRKIVEINAPRVLVEDPSDTLLGGRKRDLRFYDTVYLDTYKCLVRSTAPAWDQDGFQWCRYRVMLTDSTVTAFDYLAA